MARKTLYDQLQCYYECSKVSRSIYPIHQPLNVRVELETVTLHYLSCFKILNKIKTATLKVMPKHVQVRNVCVWVVHYLTIYRHQTCHVHQEICHKNTLVLFPLVSLRDAPRFSTNTKLRAWGRRLSMEAYCSVQTDLSSQSQTCILDLSVDFRMLLQLTKRSTSALCDFAASTRANTVLTVVWCSKCTTSFTFSEVLCKELVIVRLPFSSTHHIATRAFPGSSLL